MSALSLAPASLLRTITPDQKTDLLKKLGAIQAVRNAPFGTKCDVVSICARELKVSEQAIHTWIGLFKKRGAAALVDGRRQRGREKGLPQTTRDWIFGEFIRLQREDSGTEIYKFIRDRARLWWKTHNPKYQIPGFIDPPPIGPKGYPAGLSQETIRKCGPDKYQRALAHQGRKSASALLPGIPSSRMGTGYLENIVFDDQMYDHYVTAHGYESHMRPVGFNALDFLTGCFLDSHIRLRWWDKTEDKNRGLTQREFVWFVLGLLSSVGYRTDQRGTRLIFEHGTANSWSSQSGKLVTPGGHASFDDALFAFTDGRVTVDRSGKFNQATFKELLFAPKSTGNFRFKAPIESMFRAVRTHGGLIPAATGKDAEHAPEDSYGLEREERRWMKLANSFPEHLAEAVRSNTYSFAEYVAAYRWIYAGINADPEHALKEWAECGFVKNVWHWEEDAPDLWRDRSQLANLPAHVRETFEAQLALNPGLLRSRRMSRTEARMSLQDDPAIKRLDPRLFPQLLPLAWATAAKVNKNREIHIHEPLYRGSNADLVFFATVRNERGHRINLSPGDELLCHLDPFRPDDLIVMDQRGQPIGTAARVPDYVPTNSQIGKELIAVRAVLAADLDAPVRSSMQSVAEERREVRERNEALEERMRNVTRDEDNAPRKTPAKPPRPAARDHDPLAESLPAAPAETTEADPFI
jgi:hypothetical protein